MNDNRDSWVVVSCQCVLADEDTCSWILFEHGALGLEIENFSEQAISIKASFIAEQLRSGIDDLSGKFVQAGLSKPAKTLKAESIAKQDWMSNWKKHFEPFTVGNSFLVCPPWRVNEVTGGQLGLRKPIIIDPGMAFGTGLHATTKFCLQAIERLVRGLRILDVGTGSGILAIACALTLPKAQVLALDVDINAIDNARHNIELNKVQDRIELLQSNSQTLCAMAATKRQFDTLLSNLTVEDIVALLPIYNQLLASDGVLVMAGIVEERVGLLQSAFSEYRFRIIEQKIDRGWVGLVLVKS